jgi:nucleolar MIF4G domain-containing protein 1
LTNKFAEKEIELILLFLKTAGFKLRKDDPIALKELILNIQEKAIAVKSSK